METANGTAEGKTAFVRDVSQMWAAQKDPEETKRRHKDAETRLEAGQTVKQVLQAQKAERGMSVSTSTLYEMKDKIKKRKARQALKTSQSETPVQEYQNTSGDDITKFLSTFKAVAKKESRNEIIDVLINTLNNLKVK